jgi:hypothetical protein
VEESTTVDMDIINSLDVAYLRETAKNKIPEHLDNLGYELDKVLTGLDLLLQKVWSWANAINNEHISAKEKVMLLLPLPIRSSKGKNAKIRWLPWDKVQNTWLPFSNVARYGYVSLWS